MSENLDVLIHEDCELCVMSAKTQLWLMNEYDKMLTELIEENRDNEQQG